MNDKSPHMSVQIWSLLFLLVAGWVLCSSTGQAGAGPTDLIGPNFAVSSGQTVFQGNPADAAYSPVTRKFLVVWADTRNSSSTGSDIYGSLIDTDGGLGSEFPISTAPGDQWYPSVTYNPQTDQFLVLWTDMRTGNDIYGQLVSSQGTPVGTELPVSTAPGAQRFQDAAYNSLSNQFLVVWDDNRNCSDEVFGRLLNGDGTSSTGDFLIAGCSTGNLSRRTLAYDPGANRFLVLWGAPGGVGQFVNGDGTLSGSNVPLGLQNSPAVAFSSISGTFLAVAVDNDTPRDIHAQLITAGGIVGNVFDVSTASGRQVEPTVTRYPPMDQFFVLWRDSRNSPSPDCVSGGTLFCGEIYGQYVNVDGTLAGTEVGILVGVAPDGSGAMSPRVVYGPEADRFLVIWVDARDGCCRIFGQLVGSGVNLPTLSLPANITVDATSPSGAVVTYTASATDQAGSVPVTCNPPSGSTFAIGVTVVSCTATNQAGMTSGGFQVLVQAAAAQVSNLAATVESLNLEQGITNSLDAKLDNVLSALTAAKAGGVVSTCNQLSAFINETEAQSGKKITVDQANQLITSANQIKAVVGCP